MQLRRSGNEAKRGGLSLRILHVVPYFPPERPGGVGLVAWRLHRALSDRGHESLVLTAGPGRSEEEIIRLGSSPSGWALRLPRYGTLARRFDVVHCHQGDALGFVLTMRALRVRTPVVVTYHVGHRDMGRAMLPYVLGDRLFRTGFAGWRYRQLNARLHRATDWLMLHLAQETVFVARSTARDVLGSVGAAARANVVYCAAPAPAPLDDSDAVEPTELLYVGSAGHRKRVLALPFVLAKVRRSLPDARLRLVGFGLEQSPELASLIDELGLQEAVLCEGTLPPEGLGRFYRAAGVLLVPSVYEGLPLVILEAQRYGLPCVATRVSGHPEAIDDGRSGYLVAVDDPAAMAARCLTLLEQPDLRERMGQAARRCATERFDLDRHVHKHLALYRRACDSASSSQAGRGR